MKLLFFFLLTVIIFSCNDKNKLKQDLAKLQSREIAVPLNKMQHQVNGRDTLIANFADSELKLIVYSDSSICSSCNIHEIHLWNSFIEYAMKYHGRLKFYFLFSPAEKDLITVNLALKANIFDYPVFIDSTGIFSKENPHLPKNLQLHTFLLDENNKVILVGNPLNNPKIEELFYKIVEERLGEK